MGLSTQPTPLQNAVSYNFLLHFTICKLNSSGLAPSQKGRLKTFQTALALLCTFIPIQKSKPTRRQAADSTDIVKCKKKLHKTTFCNGVGWVDKPNVSDGLWICWVCNPTYPLKSFHTNPKNNLTSLSRLAVLSVLSAARRLVIPIQKNNIQTGSL